jgi:hypothetical protein
MEGLFPLSRMAAGGRVFGEEGKGLPSTPFNDQGNGNASSRLPPLESQIEPRDTPLSRLIRISGAIRLIQARLTGIVGKNVPG